MAEQSNTTNPSVLLELAERCEREEPCRELSDAIAFAVGWRMKDAIWWRPPGGAWALEQPLYTTSLDAAVTLVPKGWCWDAAGHSEGGNAWVMDEEDGCEHIPCFRAKTTALALCAAALRARSSLTEKR